MYQSDWKRHKPYINNSSYVISINQTLQNFNDKDAYEDADDKIIIMNDSVVMKIREK